MRWLTAAADNSSPCARLTVSSEVKDLEAALHEVMDLLERSVPLSQFQTYQVSTI